MLYIEHAICLCSEYKKKFFSLNIEVKHVTSSIWERRQYENISVYGLKI